MYLVCHTSMGTKSLRNMVYQAKDAVAHHACRLLNIEDSAKPYDDADCEFDDCGAALCHIKVIDTTLT